jgi:hypothetical protein
LIKQSRLTKIIKKKKPCFDFNVEAKKCKRLKTYGNAAPKIKKIVFSSLGHVRFGLRTPEVPGQPVKKLCRRT